MSPVPADAMELLRGGTLVRLGVVGGSGLHLTPLVYAVTADRLWVTTSRRSVKSRAWARDPRVAGLVRVGTSSVSFSGVVTKHDLLDPDTWSETLPRAGTILRAATAFTRRNARFFAGYAVDARSIPLAWMPPGRVFAEIELTRALVLEEGELMSRWGRWPRPARPRTESQGAVRAVRSTVSPFRGLPSPVVERLGRRGPGALALRGRRRDPVVLPVSWSIEPAGTIASAPSGLLGLAGEGIRLEAALEVDAGSEWRASSMVGALVAGDAEVVVPARLSSGRRSEERLLREIRASPEEDALVRIRPERVTWWQGWSSGTVSRR